MANILWYLILGINIFIRLVSASVERGSFNKNRDRITFNYGWQFRTGLTDWAAADEVAPIGVDPGLDPPESKTSYNSSTWESIHLPHDGLIANSPSKSACPNGCSGNSFIPRHVLWYRKIFSLPKHWGNEKVWVQFDGSFRNTTVWVDGKLVKNHDCGYTPFKVELDATLAGRKNYTIAVFVDPDNGDDGSIARGSGWWYEGGGLYRNAWLNRANPDIRIEDLFVYSNQIQVESNHQKALWATLHANMTLVNNNYEPKGGDLCVDISISNEDGERATPTLTNRHSISSVSHGTDQSFSYHVKLLFPQLWSTAHPYLYKVEASLRMCDTGQTFDSISTYHGIRSIQYTSDHGFLLNQEAFKIRGFCDHNTFGVVGMAVPDRINLFRAQASRSIGGNGRRTSHNPPDPTLLDIYDRLGMVVLNENRLFANNSHYVDNMSVLVKRDRNHPSVILWSFCNELGCEGERESGGPSFQNVVSTLDGTRPTLANMMTFNDLLSNTVDVQGLSHKERDVYDNCHETMPAKPIMMSECCSCNTMRGEDIGCETSRDNPHYNCNQEAFNARCLERLVNASDGVEYSSGTFVWTLFDYYGEPPSKGITVSSTYGQFDLVGFPKSAAFWFRSQWLLNVRDGRPDKTFATYGKYEVQIVESWESPDTWNETKGNTTRTVHVYSNAPMVELVVNDVSQGVLPVATMGKGAGSYAEFLNITWESGALRAIARSNEESSEELASTQRYTCGPPAALQLSLDCPSPATGTGGALLLDGQDAALVRVSIVDKRGQVVHMANNNVTFSIVSGPGRIQGTGSGNPKSYESNAAPWHFAYHGLVRAVIRPTSIAGLPADEKELLHIIDGVSGNLLNWNKTDDIVIEATSPGFEAIRLVIPTSTDPAQSVLTVAKTEARQPVDFFHLDETYDVSVATS